MNDPIHDVTAILILSRYGILKELSLLKNMQALSFPLNIYRLNEDVLKSEVLNAKYHLNSISQKHNFLLMSSLTHIFIINLKTHKLVNNINDKLSYFHHNNCHMKKLKEQYFSFK